LGNISRDLNIALCFFGKLLYSNVTQRTSIQDYINVFYLLVPSEILKYFNVLYQNKSGSMPSENCVRLEIERILYKIDKQWNYPIKMICFFTSHESVPRPITQLHNTLKNHISAYKTSPKMYAMDNYQIKYGFKRNNFSASSYIIDKNNLQIRFSKLIPHTFLACMKNVHPLIAHNLCTSNQLDVINWLFWFRRLHLNYGMCAMLLWSNYYTTII